MSTKTTLPNPGWPKRTRNKPELVITGLGTLISAIILLWPSLVECSLWMRIVAILVSLLGILIVIYLSKVVVIAIAKARNYDRLHQSLENKSIEATKAQETLLNLIKEMKERRKFEISKVLFYQEQLYIVLNKRPDLSLELGSNVVVIDSSNGNTMGEFEVTEIKKNEYNARCNGYIDPVWSGWVHQQKKSEYSPPPYTIAIVVFKEKDSHER